MHVRVAALLFAVGFSLTAIAQPAQPARSAQPAQPAATPRAVATPAPGGEMQEAAGGEEGMAVVAGDVIAAVPGEGKPYAIRRMACDEVRFSWQTGGAAELGFVNESELVVKNEGGTTGIRFIVDRARGVTIGVQTWKELAGKTVTTIPSAARVDWIDCQDADPIGGIVVEWVDARTMIP